MKKGILFLAVALLAAVFLGGCALGGFGPTVTLDPSAAAQLAVQPQELISQADAETILGNRLMPGANPSAITELPTSGMRYLYFDSASSGGRYLQISVYEVPFFGPNASPTAPGVIFNDMLPTPTPTPATPKPSATPTPTPTINTLAYTPVSGIGEKAFFLPPGLHILSQGYYIVISIGPIDSDTPQGQANREVLKTLGAKIVDNLKKILADRTPAPASATPAASPAPSAS